MPSQNLQGKGKTKRHKRVKEKHSNKDFQIPWISGFKPPNEHDRKKALGLERGASAKLFEPMSHFQSIPNPISNKDWLANMREDGQSYLQFLGTSPWLQKKKVKHFRGTYDPTCKNILERYQNGKIYLLQLKSARDSDANLNCSPIDMETLRNFVELYYSIKTEILTPDVYFKEIKGQVILEYFHDDVGSNATENKKVASTNKLRLQHNAKILANIYPTFRKHEKTNRMQLRIDTGLLDLQLLMPDDGLFLIAVTMADLYGDNTDLFTVGTGSVQHGLGIFSFFRYNPLFKQSSEEFWYDYEIKDCSQMDSTECSKIILHRALKTVVHEIGHLLGIKHCIYYSCIMNGSGHLDEDFRQPIHLCPVDLRKVISMSGEFDIVERYRNLAKFYRSMGMNTDAIWVQNRLSSIS